MNQNTRIKLTDTPLSATVKLCEGNPGAITVCIQMLEKGKQIDPDNLFGGPGCLFSLDSHSIYGPQIWMLYKDVCKEDIVKTIAVLQSVQLGFLSEEKLHVAINNYGTGIDVEELYDKVKDTLPRFDLPKVI